jgi:PiT family inorganic phosphate transporter
MGIETIILIVALVLGFYMAWNIGANDVANAMGTSVGSGALTMKRAIVIAAIFEFSGALLVGSHVSETIERGIVNPEIFATQPMTLVYGMLASLLAAGVWLQIASYYGWPVSTTHSIIGAVVGFGLILGGAEAIYWGNFSNIILSWILSPLIGGCISFMMFTLLRKKIFYTADPVQSAKKLAPIFVFLVFMILSLITLFQGLSNLHLDLSFLESMAIALPIGVISALITKKLLNRIQVEPKPERAQQIRDLQAYTSLKKTIKHLQRVAFNSQGDFQQEISQMLRRAETLSRTLKDVHVQIDGSEYAAVERIFVYLQILSACCMAFAHGANDVANAIGPLAAIISILKTGTIPLYSEVPAWILALGGIGIVIGLATWGWRVIETIGKKITELTPTRGFAAEFGAATTILVASRLGLPVSTTHTLVGSVLGVGLARGIDALNLHTIRDIVLSWVITVPVGAILSIIFYYLFRTLFS